MKQSETFGLLKPDCLYRNLEEIIFAEILDSGFQIPFKKRIRLNKEDAVFLYPDTVGKPFFSAMISYMISHDSIGFIATLDDGRNAQKELTKMVGYFNPLQADDGTIRKKYSIPNYFPFNAIQNIIHSSSDQRAFERESKYFLPEYWKHRTI
jgi:nucleoside-diphosphate kinase